MLSSTFRPIARSAVRSIRQLSSQAQQGAAHSGSSLRYAAVAASALAAGGYAVYVREPTRNDNLRDWIPKDHNQSVRESVLDQNSLKVPLHKRTSPAQQESAQEVVKQKAKQADEEAGPQGAFNEETGEINWDCPCLGGMAQGPCGEDFKAAFSCFVFSDVEPKGMDCVEKFQAMQTCFRKHPEIYAEEIDDDQPKEGESAGASYDAPVPKAPEKNPASRENNVITKQTHLNNPAKGVEKLRPRGERMQGSADKAPGNPSPAHGDGSA